MSFQTFFKSLDYTFWKADRKRQKRLEKARLARHKRLVESLENDRIRREVYARDKGKCRVCGSPVLLHTADDWKLAHVHHIRYRSAGGTDTLDNLCLLDLRCHALEHEHTLDIQGDANDTLTITRWPTEPHAEESSLTEYSPCPS